MDNNNHNNGQGAIGPYTGGNGNGNFSARPNNQLVPSTNGSGRSSPSIPNSPIGSYNNGQNLLPSVTNSPSRPISEIGYGNRVGSEESLVRSNPSEENVANNSNVESSSSPSTTDSRAGESTEGHVNDTYGRIEEITNSIPLRDL
jgi:hypothetical protein